MNRWLVLGVGLGAVLGAAVVYSLMGDEHDSGGTGAPTTTSRAAPRPGSGGVDEPGDPQRPRAGDTPDDEEHPGANAPLPPFGSTGVVDATPPGEGPPPPLAESPFATENSAEIDYAFELAIGPDSGIDSARAAIDVFDRCLKASPQNRRCYDGLVAAQQRLDPAWTPPGPPKPLSPTPGLPPRTTRTTPHDPSPQGTPPTRPMDFRKK